ncbi:hypothetical protein B0H10DRAFT_2138920 [Mycena sp. CBHHK59/15]|nr:hypothetical protein B0H10DRAFT_2138920 [Mycena sp. CBHHK59/15]
MLLDGSMSLSIKNISANLPQLHVWSDDTYNAFFWITIIRCSSLLTLFYGDSFSAAPAGRIRLS